MRSDLPRSYPKRTIAEWLTVSRVARDVGHFFSEGPSDARLLRHAYGYPSTVDFRTAEEISDEDLPQDPLCGGFKVRLLMLAIAADKSRIENILCLVDADFACFASHLLQSNNAVETVYANLPAGTLTRDWLAAFLTKGYGFVLNDTKWNFLCDTLRFAFVMRFLLSEHFRKALDVSSFVNFHGGVFDFNKQSYVRSYVQARTGQSELIASIENTVEWIQLDIRNTLNSNDLFALIYIFLRKEGKIGGSYTRDAIRDAYFSAFEDGALRDLGGDILASWMARYSNSAK